MTPPEGLRARRRRQTERDIHLVALRLARQRGMDAVTVEAISIEAGIAPRTFFNYFPSKEAAVVHGPVELADQDVAVFVDAGIVPYPQLLTDVIELLAGGIDITAMSRDELHDVFAVAQQHAGVLAAMLAQLDRFQRQVAGLVAGRMAVPPDDEVANLIAALAFTILRTGFDRWASSPADTGDDPISYIRHAAELTQRLFDPGAS